MARSAKIKKRAVQTDRRYQSRLVAKLVNRIMVSGKKTVAQKHVYEAFEIID